MSSPVAAMCTATESFWAEKVIHVRADQLRNFQAGLRRRPTMKVGRCCAVLAAAAAFIAALAACAPLSISLLLIANILLQHYGARCTPHQLVSYNASGFTVLQSVMSSDECETVERLFEEGVPRAAQPWCGIPESWARHKGRAAEHASCALRVAELCDATDTFCPRLRTRLRELGLSSELGHTARFVSLHYPPRDEEIMPWMSGFVDWLRHASSAVLCGSLARNRSPDSFSGCVPFHKRPDAVQGYNSWHLDHTEGNVSWLLLVVSKGIPGGKGNSPRHTRSVSNLRVSPRGAHDDVTRRFEPALAYIRTAAQAAWSTTWAGDAEELSRLSGKHGTLLSQLLHGLVGCTAELEVGDLLWFAHDISHQSARPTAPRLALRFAISSEQLGL